MVTITKKEAKEIGLQYSTLCSFHDRYPDQDGIFNHCPDCKMIRDPCGCGEDEGCELCCPNDFKKLNTEKGLTEFVKKMKSTLDIHQEEKGDSWVNCDIEYLEKKLMDEIGEYEIAERPLHKAEELVDIANMCMMLFHRHLDICCENKELRMIRKKREYRNYRKQRISVGRRPLSFLEWTMNEKGTIFDD